MPTPTCSSRARSSSARRSGPVDLSDYRLWWHWTPGARWDRPEGPDSDVATRDRHPVTHVAYEDVTAYAAWAGKELPTEAEWEFAARGGLDGAVYTWGDEFAPKGRMMANTWQGEFPWQNLRTDRVRRHVPGQVLPGQRLRPVRHGRQRLGMDRRLLSPVASRGDDPRLLRASPVRGVNPRVETADGSFNVGQPGEKFPRMVVKGGSHLCAPNYCLRYRPAARQAQTVETSMAHLGFRCIVRKPN